MQIPFFALRCRWDRMYVILDVCNHVFQILAKHTKSVKKKFAKHFKKVYNLLDFLAVILFLFGFAIKAELNRTDNADIAAGSDSTMKPRHDLTKFS